MALISDCCGARPKSNGDSDSIDHGICSSCGEHCEYIDDEDENFNDHPDNLIALDALYNKKAGSEPAN